MLYMVNHGFSTGALFIVVGLLIAAAARAAIDDYGGVQKVAPMLAGLFLLAGLSALALPGLSTLRQRVPGAGRARSPGTRSPAILATVGIMLAAIYILLAVPAHDATGPARQKVERFRDLTPREMCAVGAAARADRRSSASTRSRCWT